MDKSSRTSDVPIATIITRLTSCFDQINYCTIQPEVMSVSRVEETSNIQVAIRVRPLIDREIKSGETSIIRTEDNLIVEL